MVLMPPATFKVKSGISHLVPITNVTSLAEDARGIFFTISNNTLTRFPSTGERSFDETNYNGRFTTG